MDNLFMQVGNRIRDIRQVLDIPAAEMARVTGVSEKEYLEHEEGKVDSCFSFLYLCAERFGIDVSDLVRGEQPRLTFYNVTRKGQGMPIKRRAELDYHHLAPMIKNRHAEPLLVMAQPQDESLPIPLSTHSGHEFDYILSGQLRVQLGDTIEVLNPGDSVFYDSGRPHGMVAGQGKPCQFLAIVMQGAGDLPHKVEIKKSELSNRNERDFIYRRFMDETLDERGCLKGVKFHYPDNFNFAYDVVDALAEKVPDKVALHWIGRDNEEKIFTFRDISRLSCKAANYLVSLGVKRGDRVMMVLRRNWQFWILQMALHRIGATSVLAVNQLLKHDFVYRFNKANIKAVIITAFGDVMKEADAAANECPGVLVRIGVNGTIPGWQDFDASLELFSDTFKRPEDQKSTDPMLMFFSSGTTGYPKLVTHSFSYPLGHIVTARWWQDVNPDGLHLTISDTGWAKAMWGKLYGQWLCETGVFVYDFDRFNADEIMPLFAKCGITTFCAPPTMYRFFIRQDLSKYDFSTLQHAAIAGEALNPEVFNQFLKSTGLKVMEGFGQTESTAIIANLVGMDPKPGSMGKPTPAYDVHLLGPDGNPVPSGQVGEICIKAEPHQVPGLFYEYGGDEENTKAAWHDGFYHTGDTAWVDEDGYYWYEGRIDDLIKSSGYRIGPFEVESAIMELPYVLECAVVGVPDPVRTQLVKAFIVLTKGKEPSEELKKEIQEYVKHATAPYKYPRLVDFVTELPKTASGKIKRNELRKMY
ncbi:MAG: AMP-binding protein [Victivallaceae bacterium]|nr:AMP-binding protein [Victivallaceae bacterium]